MKDYSKIRTLDDFKRFGYTESYTIPNSTYFQRYEDLVILKNLAYDKYDKYLSGISYLLELSDDDLNKYRFKPDLLSTELYGTPTLQHLILYINATSEYDFQSRYVKLIPPDYIDQVYTYIMSHESSHIKANNKIAVG